MAAKRYEPPYHCWHEKDFWGDREVIRMLPVQRHFYRTLIQAAFHASTRPNLPDDDAQLWVLADADNLEHWMANMGPVRAKFEPFVDESGLPLLAHKRITNDWNQMMDYIAKKSKAGVARHRKAALAQHAAAPALKQKLKTEMESISAIQNQTVTEPATASGQGSVIGCFAEQGMDYSTFDLDGNLKPNGYRQSEPNDLSVSWQHLFGSEGSPVDFEKIIERHYADDPERAPGEIEAIMHWAAVTSNHWNPKRSKTSRGLLSAFQEIRRQWSLYMDKAKQGAEERRTRRRPSSSGGTEAGDDARGEDDSDDAFEAFQISDEELDI